MPTKTHYLIFSTLSGFDLGKALALLPAIEAEASEGDPARPTRIEAAGDETRVFFGPEYVGLAVTPLAGAVAVLHRAIDLENYTEADQYVYRPGHALRVWVEQDDDDDRWALNPECFDEGREHELRFVLQADAVVAHALIDAFPPAVFVMGTTDPDGVHLCFPSEPRAWDWE